MYLSAIKRQKFTKWNDEAIEFLRKLVLVDGWSLSYSLSFFKGGKEGFAKEVHKNEKLRKLYEEIRKVTKRRYPNNSFYINEG